MTKLEEIMVAALGGAENAGDYHYDDAVIRAAVLAALKAMREPSDWQIDGIPDNLLGGYGFGDDCYSANPEAIWVHMIDALLSEERPK